MFKKIEIWILYLVILLSILFAIGFGVLVRQELVGGIKAGWVSKTALAIVEMPGQLRGAFIGSINIEFLSKPATYLARLPERFLMEIIVEPFRVDDPWKEKKSFYNQTGFEGSYDTFERYLLLSRFDGDIKQGVVELVDLTNFNVLHTWNPDIDKFNDLVEKTEEFKYLNRDANNARHMLHHPVLTNKGDLYFREQVTPLRKIDSCSRLVWQNEHDVFHHSTRRTLKEISGSTYMYPQSLPIERVGRQHVSEGGYLDDAIVKLSPDGEILYEKSVSQLLIDNQMESRLGMIGTNHEFQIDPIHINDIQPVNFDGKYWKKGDLFLSLGHQSMLILFRPSTNEILWKYDKNIFHQHDINILNENEISIFNNNRKYFFPSKDIVEGHNEVLIYNFYTGEVRSYLKNL